MKIDGHIHFADDLEAGRLLAVTEEQKLTGLALLCIPKGGERPVEQDAISFREKCSIPVWIFGGLDREIFRKSNDLRRTAAALADEIERLMRLGCTGIKMLEGKPDVRKKERVPDFDSPVWEPYWAELERRRIPVIMHVNDPEEFWDAGQVSDYAKKAGWFYDESYVNNEAQYEQMLHVLESHPRLRILFPHLYFMSRQLPRLSSILERFSEVRVDITPGAELYYNLSENAGQAAYFFEKYQDRICYGTDIGARSVIWKEPKPLSMEESRARERLVMRFLETRGDYVLESDGFYINDKKPTHMHGLGLPEKMLEKIYGGNFMAFISPHEPDLSAS